MAAFIGMKEKKEPKLKSTKRENYRCQRQGPKWSPCNHSPPRIPAFKIAALKVLKNAFSIYARLSPWLRRGSEYYQTRPSRPIRCDVWIVKQMRYPTDRPTDQPTDTASYRGALSHLKRKSYEARFLIQARFLTERHLVSSADSRKNDARMRSGSASMKKRAETTASGQARARVKRHQ